MDTTDLLINDIHRILPANTYQDIAYKVSCLRLGEPISVRQIDHALRILRANSDFYGWTIPYVKGGSPTEDRFFPSYVSGLGGPYTEGDQRFINSREGSITRLRTLLTQTSNLKTQTDIGMEYITNESIRALWRVGTRDMNHAQETIKEILRNLGPPRSTL
jgi:hypothetical protein